MRKWNKLPKYMQNNEVELIYDSLKKKFFYRFIKRLFDFFASLFLFVLLLLPSLLIAIIIPLTSKGSPIFKQERVGRYGKSFIIFKFRTMKIGSEQSGQITSKNDSRVTKFGKFLRKTHIDEFPQLLNVLVGQMSFVGTRPEVPMFLEYYRPIWMATLLMRPGITSTSAIVNTNESEKIAVKENKNEYYVNTLMPQKMEMNINDLRNCGLFYDIKIMWRTVF